MNLYLYNDFGGSLRMSDVLDTTYNAYVDRPIQGYCMFKENTAKALPVIDLKEIVGTYVLLDCPLSQVQDYFREKGVRLDMNWLQADISFGVGIVYIRSQDTYYYRHFSETDVMYYNAMSRARIVEPQQLVFR